MPSLQILGAVIDVPPEWCARVLSENAVLLYQRGEDPGVHPADYSRSIAVSRTPTTAPFGVFVRQLMRRRVPQGYPTVLPPLFIDGVRALGLDYTDGVRGISTWFVPVERGYVHEVTIAVYIAPRAR